MTERDRAQNEANDEAGAKGNRRQLVGTFLFDISWIGIDVWFVWPISHVAALWFAVTILAIQVFGSSFVAQTRYSALIIIGLVGIVAQVFLPPNETETHGWLRPGSAPNLPTGCKFKSPGFFVHCGTGMTIALPAKTTSVSLIRIYGVDLLSLAIQGDRLAVNAKVFDDSGIIAEIVDNEFRLNQANMFRADRPDAHTLIVYDRWAAPVVQVVYVNRRTVWINGVFRYKGISATIEPELIVGPNGNKISGNCVGVADRVGFALGPVEFVTDWRGECR